MKALLHVFSQPFIVATGLAALIHSTWSTATLFSGPQPDLADWPHLVGWLIPALLIAFALDVGQIATSSQIRLYGLTLGRGITFFVFAVATYYLQWIYIAHHMPALALGAGVSVEARQSAVFLRDAAIWIIPAFLPLSTILYTFSAKQESDRPAAPARPRHAVLVSTPVDGGLLKLDQAHEAIHQELLTAGQSELALTDQAAQEEPAPALPFGNTAPDQAALESSMATVNTPAMPTGPEPTESAKRPPLSRKPNRK